jgi:tyrosine-protein kinase Etk/Wzc
LRALEREAKAQRDLLESYLAKYREANTRESLDTAPAEGRIISRAVVSNTPAYPKKLPIVLIATVATLMLTSGVVVTGELLRITAPNVSAAVLAAPARNVATTAPRVEPVLRPVASPAAPPSPAALPEPFRKASEIAQLAADLLAAGTAAHKVTVLGSAGGEAVTRAALELARAMAQNARVVLVDLAGAPQFLANASVDPTAPGLVELMLGEASFAGIITKDQRSRLQLVSAGRPGSDRSQLQSPRLALALDALQRVYDHVLLDAGNGSDLPAELLTSGARAVVVSDGAMATGARAQICEQLAAVGFGAVTVLERPAVVSDLGEAASPGVAA